MPISPRFVVNFTVLLLSVGFLVLFGIIGMTIWLGERAQIYFDEASSLRDLRIAAVELRSALQSAESSERGFLIGGNEIYLAPYDSAKAHIDDSLARVQQLLAGSARDDLLTRLSNIISDKITEMDRTIALKTEFKDNEALTEFSSNRGKALMDEANVFLSSIIRNADESLTAGIAEQRRNALCLRLLSTIGGLVIVTVVGGVIFTLFRYAGEISRRSRRGAVAQFDARAACERQNGGARAGPRPRGSPAFGSQSSCRQQSGSCGFDGAIAIELP